MPRCFFLLSISPSQLDVQGSLAKRHRHIYVNDEDGKIKLSALDSICKFIHDTLNPETGPPERRLVLHCESEIKAWIILCAYRKNPSVISFIVYSISML
jgi:hypothetical protein